PDAEHHPHLRPLRRVADDRSRRPPAMKAAICYALDEAVRVEDVVLDAPKENEVLVRMAASGVCHSDRSVISGIMPAKLPCVLGHEGAGIVAGVGAGVTHVKEGDRVVL